MGSVSVTTQASRDLTILATDLPYGSTVDVVRGVVDYAGASSPDPVTTKTTLPLSAFAGGSTQVSIDTTTSVFVRVVVRSSTGKVIAGSNPVWLLRSDPPGGIPFARRGLPPGPVGPNASFTWVATLLDVQLDGSASSQGDAPLSTYAWDFGDGEVSTDQSPSHSFALPGTYSVVLVVTDEAGLTDTLARSITVAEASTVSLSHVASARSNANTAAALVAVPSSVLAGDALLLFVTLNTTSRTVGLPPGWSLVAEKTSGAEITKVLQRTAGASDAGSVVKVTIGGGFAKTALELLAYRGISSATFATATGAALGATTSEATPAATVVEPGSWVVSYWVAKSSNGISAWTPPADVVVRGQSFGTAGGALSTLAADSGQAVSPGPCGGLVAVPNAASITAPRRGPSSYDRDSTETLTGATVGINAGLPPVGDRVRAVRDQRPTLPPLDEGALVLEDPDGRVVDELRRPHRQRPDRRAAYVRTPDVRPHPAAPATHRPRAMTARCRPPVPSEPTQDRQPQPDVPGAQRRRPSRPGARGCRRRTRSAARSATTRPPPDLGCRGRAPGRRSGRARGRESSRR